MSHSVIVGDCREKLKEVKDGTVHCVVTSPPYWGQREYGDDSREIGREGNLTCSHLDCGECYVCHMVKVFDEVRRVLRDDGLLWLNIGDKAVGGWMGAVPHRTLIALVDKGGWGFGQEVIWSKKSSMPGGSPRRCNQAHEPVYMLAKNSDYFYDDEALRVPEAKGVAPVNPATVAIVKRGKSQGNLKSNANKTVARADGMAKRRSVWSVNQGTPDSPGFFAPMPEALADDCVRASTSEAGACPECGAAWSRVVSKRKIFRPRPRKFTKRTGAKGTGNACPNDVDKTQTVTLGFYPRCDCVAVPDLTREPRYRDPACPTAEELKRHGDWEDNTRALLTKVRSLPTVPCLVLDPFSGLGTTGASALRHHCRFVGVELYPGNAKESLRHMGRAAPVGRPVRRMSESVPEDGSEDTYTDW